MFIFLSAQVADLITGNHTKEQKRKGVSAGNAGAKSPGSRRIR